MDLLENTKSIPSCLICSFPSREVGGRDRELQALLSIVIVFSLNGEKAFKNESPPPHL